SELNPSLLRGLERARRRKAFALRLSVRDRSTRPVTPINFLQKIFLQLVHFISYVPASLKKEECILCNLLKYKQDERGSSYACIKPE
ncbi:hypothetical protein ACFPOH_06340, partial [Ureibacillus suwonensis]